MTAEELLNSVSPLAEEKEEWVINGENRGIEIPNSPALFGVEGDIGIERKYFRCPKIVGDGVDLSTHQIYIAYVQSSSLNASSFPEDGVGTYHVEDKAVEGDDITFSWKLSGNVLKESGYIAFKMYAKKSETDVVSVFNTTPAYGNVLMTVPDGEDLAETYPDVINQLFEKLENLSIDPEEIQAAVEGYLEEHPIPSTPVDNTLTQEGQAADAKKTGDELNKKLGTEHNTSPTAHNDIRDLISGLTTRLNTLADSDDDTLDQLSEIVTYIKNNKTLIDNITTGKVSVSDIVDNLTSTATNKPLSAAQGRALKGLIDTIVVPDELPNPEYLTILVRNAEGEGNQIVYDCRQSKSIEVSPDTLGLSPSGGGGSSGGITLIQETELTTWAQNGTLTIEGISDYDMIGIEVYPNYATHADEYSSIQWFRVEESGTRNYTLYAMDVNGSAEGEGNVRRISINFDTGVITSVSNGYYYNWSNRGANAQSCVPSRIFGMKF